MNRQTQTLVLVLQDTDDSPVIVPYVQDLEFAQWEDGRIPFECVRASTGLTADCTGGAFILTMRRNYYDGNPPVLSRAAVAIAVDFSTGYFPVTAFDTGVTIADYRVDVDFIDAGGNRWQCLPASTFTIAEAEGIPDTDVTVPASEVPLAQGPQGYPTSYGVYSGSTSYIIGQGVSYTLPNGATSSYICIANTTGNAPPNSTYWLLQASGQPPHQTVDGLDTTLMATGLFAYVSGTNAVNKTDSASFATAKVVGVYLGGVGSIQAGVGDVIETAKFTTDGGSPLIGDPVWLAAASDDSGAGAGKLTAVPPSAGVIAEVGIVLSNANYGSAKTCRIVYLPKAPVVL